MLPDVTTNSSRTNLNHMIERCQTLPQTAAEQIWTTWWNAVRRYHKQQQDKSEPLDGTLPDVTTNSSRTNLNHLMERCQTLPQTAAEQIWTTWSNVVRRYHKQQQNRSEPPDGMLSDVTTNSSRTNLNHLMECCQTLPQTAIEQIWTTWWNAVRRYHKQQQDRSEPPDGMLSDVTTNSSRTDLNHLMERCQMSSQTDGPAMSLNISRHKGCTKPVEVLSYLSKAQRSLYQPNVQLLEQLRRPPSVTLYN